MATKPTIAELMAQIEALKGALAQSQAQNKSAKPAKDVVYDTWYADPRDKSGKTQRLNLRDGGYKMRGVTDGGRKYETHFGPVQPELALSDEARAAKKAAKAERAARW